MRSTRPIARWLAASLCCVLLLASVAAAQIDVPAEAEQYTLVKAKLTAPIPDGGYLADGGWEIDGASMEVVGNDVVFTGKPGTYAVVYDGVILKDVTFTDGAGQQITIKSYLGRIKAKATCKIKGTVDPNPPDPPQPGGKKQVVLWLSEKQLPYLSQGQRDILTSVVFREWMESQGHVLLEVLDPANFQAGSVPERYRAWVNSVAGKKLPAISVAPKDGGQIATYDLPAGIDEAKTLIDGKAVR